MERLTLGGLIDHKTGLQAVPGVPCNVRHGTSSALHIGMPMLHATDMLLQPSLAAEHALMPELVLLLISWLVIGRQPADLAPCLPHLEQCKQPQLKQELGQQCCDQLH